MSLIQTSHLCLKEAKVFFPNQGSLHPYSKHNTTYHSVPNPRIRNVYNLRTEDCPVRWKKATIRCSPTSHLQCQSPVRPLYLMEYTEVPGVLGKWGRGDALRVFGVVTIDNTYGNISII